MSAPTKLRANTGSEITRLKAVWLTMSDDARDFWRELFVSDSSQAEIRRQLFAKLKINLKYDSKLNAFRDWELQQRAMDLEAERQAEDERRLLAEFGTDKLELVREKVLKKTYARSMAAGDSKLALATVDRDVSVARVTVDQAKLVLMQKKSDAYDRAQAALTSAKTSKGGLTKETLEKIEAELKLL